MILNDSTTIFIDFHKKKNLKSIKKSNGGPHNMSSSQKKLEKILQHFRFQISRTRNCDRGPPKLDFCTDPVDPPDHAEMEHELQLATYGHRAGGQDDGSLKKTPSNYEKKYADPDPKVWASPLPNLGHENLAWSNSPAALDVNASISSNENRAHRKNGFIQLCYQACEPRS